VTIVYFRIIDIWLLCEKYGVGKTIDFPHLAIHETIIKSANF